jgi:hypothetical protein
MAVVVGLAESPTPIPIHIRPANSHGTLGATANSLAVFLIAIAVWGIAYSLSFLGGLTLVNAAAPDRHRAASLHSISSPTSCRGRSHSFWGWRQTGAFAWRFIWERRRFTVMGIVAIALIIAGRLSADE